MRLVEPTSIIWEDHNERHKLSKIVLYGREYRFYREGNNIILREFSG